MGYPHRLDFVITAVTGKAKVMDELFEGGMAFLKTNISLATQRAVKLNWNPELEPLGKENKPQEIPLKLSVNCHFD